MIPIGLVTVVNPRVRSKRIFKEIVANIAELGLKRPVTVARREHPNGPRYELVCGQGRLEAYRALGQREIPALVVDADAEDCLVMSLVENCARRQHRAIDLLHDIDGLKHRGYSQAEIARKTGLSLEYVQGGQIPVSMAVEIAEADDIGVQHALQQAYEQNLLRGRKLLIAKRVIEQRRRRGKGLRTTGAKGKSTLSTEALLRAYRQETDKKRLLIRKAETTRGRLVFVTEALRKLLADEHFVTLLRAEGLDTLPRPLADRFQARGQT
jgi:ParB family chromosome partitioning protein